MASDDGLPRILMQVARTNNLVMPVSEAGYQSPKWTTRYAKAQPGYIAHPNYGPCLIYAKRETPSVMLMAGRLYYLVSLVTPVDDRQLRETRQGFFQVPAAVSFEDDVGASQIAVFVFTLAKVITNFVLADVRESSRVTVYDGNAYTEMLLSELRHHIDVERDTTYSIAFDAFKQTNPGLIAMVDIMAPTVVTPAAEARLIASTLKDDPYRYALAPHFISEAQRRNDALKGRKHIDACIAEPMHDTDGLIARYFK